MLYSLNKKKKTNLKIRIREINNEDCENSSCVLIRFLNDKSNIIFD